MVLHSQNSAGDDRAWALDHLLLTSKIVLLKMLKWSLPMKHHRSRLCCHHHCCWSQIQLYIGMQGPDSKFVRVLLLCGKMIGAVLIGETEMEEAFQNLILDGLDISSLGADILDPDCEIDHVFDWFCPQRTLLASTENIGMFLSICILLRSLILIELET